MFFFQLWKSHNHKLSFRKNGIWNYDLKCRKRNLLYPIRQLHFLNGNVSNLYNTDVIIYQIKKESWEQFCLWTSLPNFPIITTLVKYLVALLDITGFFFCIHTQVKKETVESNTGRFLCFNSTVSYSYPILCLRGCHVLFSIMKE
jgi:hypothetical protein